MRKFVLTSLCAVFSLSLFLPTSNAASIEAVKGKAYTITKQHGPWMIMVASFSNVQDKNFRKEGFSAREAAVELVYHLRKKGVPAYVFEQDARKERIQTSNRLRRSEQRVYTAQHNMISVLAGNYPSIEDKKARQTLYFIKNFKADFLLENGGRFKPTPGQPTPLSGAFLTVNPLLSPEEVKAATADPLLIRLNTQHDYSLFENPHQYTLAIATFSGGSSKFMLGGDEQQKQSLLEQLKPSESLDKAAMDAWKLAEAMRNASKYGYGEDYEVYVWHDHQKSIVTIGGFNSMDDPQIQRLMKQFQAKRKPRDKNPNQVDTIPEFFVIPRATLPNSDVVDLAQAKQRWIFDPVPRVIKVPKYNR